jgi:hypothetical protein
MKASEILKSENEKYYKQVDKTIIENNISLIDGDIKVKYNFGMLLSNRGDSATVHYWKGEYYYNNFSYSVNNYKHVKTIKQLCNLFKQDIENGYSNFHFNRFLLYIN